MNNLLFFGHMTRTQAAIMLCVLIPFGIWMIIEGRKSNKQYDRYRAWLKLRRQSRDSFKEKLCYCGHTTKCDCGDPSLDMFLEAVERGDIIENDPANGWKKGE